MLKKVILVVLSIGLAFSLSAQNISDFAYTTGYGYISITKYFGDENDIVIPERINGLPVRRIGDAAFYYDQLTTVIIPNSVEIIGDHAFAENRLASIIIPDSVKMIGSFAFAENYLTTVVIPNSVESIGNEAFADNLLTSVIVSHGVKNIEDEAFADNRLTTIVIPDTVEYLGYRVMGGNIPMNGETDTTNEFSTMTYKNEITITAYNNRGKQDVIIPDEINGLPVTHIDAYVFQNNFGSAPLTSVVLPNDLKTIGNAAFAYNQLSSLIIPNSVEYIGVRAFFRNEITNIDIPESVISIGHDAFSANYISSVIIPDSVEYLGENAFSQNFSIESENDFSIMIHKNTVTITACNNQDETEIIIPENINGFPVTAIGTLAFAFCSLTSVIIPNSIISIGDDAFTGLNQLTSVVIPDSVKNLSDKAFRSNVEIIRE